MVELVEQWSLLIDTEVVEISGKVGRRESAVSSGCDGCVGSCTVDVSFFDMVGGGKGKQRVNAKPERYIYLASWHVKV